MAVWAVAKRLGGIRRVYRSGWGGADSHPRGGGGVQPPLSSAGMLQTPPPTRPTTRCCGMPQPLVPALLRWATVLVVRPWPWPSPGRQGFAGRRRHRPGAGGGAAGPHILRGLRRSPPQPEHRSRGSRARASGGLRMRVCPQPPRPPLAAQPSALMPAEQRPPPLFLVPLPLPLALSIPPVPHALSLGPPLPPAPPLAPAPASY